MKNVDQWKPTKAERHNGTWRASRDPSEVGPASRMIVDLGTERLAELFARHARGDLLDVGCGKVPFYGMYREQTTSVTCVDWASTLHTSPHLDVEADLTQPLPLPDDSFDTVVATDVLEHLPHPDVLWDEMQRVLRPGGKVIGTVPFLYQLHEEPHDFHRYTRHKLAGFCADHGFELVELHAVGGLGVTLIEFTLRAIARKPALVATVGRALASIGRSRGRRTAPETIWPLGYSFVAYSPTPDGRISP